MELDDVDYAAILVLAITYGLLGLYAAWTLMPMRWRRWIARTEQDSVNEQTVETLTTVMAGMANFEERIASAEVQLDRQAAVFSRLNDFLKANPPEALTPLAGVVSLPPTAGPPTSPPSSSPVPPRPAATASRTATPTPATETTSD